MYKDFLPTSDGDQLNWFPNFKDKIATHGATLGLTAAEIATIQDDCDDAVEAILNDRSQRNAALMAGGTKRLTLRGVTGRVRNNIARLKTSPGYTDAIGEDLGCVGTTIPLDPATYRPKLRANAIMEAVLLNWVRGDAHQVKLYGRLKGQADWQFLAISTGTTYIDRRELAQPNVPEVREYMACGVVDDEEIGQPSDIVTVVFAG